MEGNYNVHDIVAAIQLSRAYKGKPAFINVRTTIGVDTAVAGTFKAHHGAIDQESVSRWKRKTGVDPASSHVISPRSLTFFRERKEHGARLHSEWNARLEHYCQRYPEIGRILQSRFNSSTDLGIKLLLKLDSA